MVALGVDPKKLYICEQCKKPLHTECVQQQRIASCALCRSPIKDIKFRQVCDEYKMENTPHLRLEPMYFSSNESLHTQPNYTHRYHYSDVPRVQAMNLDGSTFYPSPPDTPVYDEENPNGDGWDYGDY
jgi:hypothetical protein